MRTETYNVYTFGELSQEAKKHAIAKWQEAELEDVSNFFTEESKSVLKDFGFEKPEVLWSLSNCQGDGFSFTVSTMQAREVIQFLRFVSDEVQGEPLGLVEKIVNRLNALYCEMDICINPTTIREYEYSVSMERNHSRYVHSRSVDVEGDYCDNYAENSEEITPPEVAEYFQLLGNFFQCAYLLICDELEKYGYECLEYEMSEGEYQELADGNCHEFLEDGTMIF